MVVFEDLNAFLQTYQYLTKKFPENPVSKNAFLTVCRLIDNSKDIEDINSLCPYGGIIGPGNSCLNNYLYFSKIIRVHAIFHDAFGFMKTTYDTGPGYIYMLPNLPNHFLLGHISGIAYWSFVKIVNSNLFDKLPF